MGSSTAALRSDSFPAGLRVLLVDHDHACSTNLQKMLLKCKYQVSICNLAQEALDLLQTRRDGFDIVMSDVNVPDMDGFKFLEQVGLKMDLPVIMMSEDGETSRVMKGVQHGACDYLVKPIRMRELRNIWQHVFRKRIHEVRGVEPKESLDQTLKSDDSSSFSEDNNKNNKVSSKKRKDVDSKNDIESSDHSSAKKPRVVWTDDLHLKFIKAVNRIGLDKVGPKKILDLMGVPWLTRENVASHLQKFRLYLSRQQKENDLKAACSGMKLMEYSPKDHSERPNSLTLQQNIVINEKNYASAAGQEIHIHSHSHSASICEGNVAGMMTMPMQAEGEKLLFGEVADPPISSSSRIGYNQPLELLKSESKIQAHYAWSGGAPSSHFKHHLRPHFQPEHRFDHHFPLVSHNHGPLRREADQDHDQDQDQPMEANINNHFYSKNRSYAIGTDHHHTGALLSIPQQGYLTHCQTPLEPVPRPTWSTNNHDEEQNNLESSFKSMIVGTGSAAAAAAALRLRDVELNAYSYLQNPQHVNLESFGCSSNHEDLVADARHELYDSHNFEDEYDSNGVECYVTNQGLYYG